MNSNKYNSSLLYDMSGWSQLFFLCFFAFVGFIIGMLIMVFTTQAPLEVSWSMRITQVVITLCLFVLPSLFFAHLTQPNFKAYLKFDTTNDTVFFILAGLLIVGVQPFINLVAYYNQQLVLPESMIGIETWMKVAEQQAEDVLSLFLIDKTPLGIISNLIIIALVAGLAEELFFRGCLQQIMSRIINNKHFAIWITAIIFSVIHFQFYGFVPRLLLGALLGYLFYWSANLWVPIFVHTLNNAVTMSIIQIYYGTPEYKEMENLNMNNHIWLALLSLIFSIFILLLLYKRRHSNNLT